MDRGGVADITTKGRRTGRPHRVEIYFHHYDGEYYLAGMPGPRRDWQANIEANGEFTLHLKRGLTVDVAVVGEWEPDPTERAKVIRRVLNDTWPESARTDQNLQEWVDYGPFIRFRPLESG